MKKKSHNKSFYKEKVVVLAFGLTGCGKSEFGNAFLQLINAFNASNDCNSVTFRTNIRKKLIDMIWRYYIDTPGFSSSDGKDNEYIEALVKLLNEEKIPINAFFIIINIQEPRCNAEIQNMLFKINNFYNNPKCWERTALIFTKSFLWYNSH